MFKWSNVHTTISVLRKVQLSITNIAQYNMYLHSNQAGGGGGGGGGEIFKKFFSPS